MHVAHCRHLDISASGPDVMIRWPFMFVMAVLLYVAFCITFSDIDHARHRNAVFTPPPPAWSLKIMALGQRQAMAELLFTRLMFYNEALRESEDKEVDPALILKVTDIATELDPYNMDCYYFAQALLGDLSQYVAAFNRILERGMKYRKNDFYLPWFIGVNYYFTLDDPARAAPYFAETARRKPDSRLFSTFASRVFYEGDETRQAVVFLKLMLAQARYPALKNKIRIRLKAMETVLFLERALRQYRRQTGEYANGLDDLVRAGILKAIPPDPYGGKFYLAGERRVRTTSSFSFAGTGKHHASD